MECSCQHPGGLDFTEELLREIPLKKGASVLDAGCGCGYTVKWLTEDGYKAYGIDKEPRIEGDNIASGDMADMPYADGTFDAVISECTAFISGNTAGFLKECGRILKPGGFVLLSDVYFHEDRPIPRFQDHRPTKPSDWKRLLEEAGLRLINTEDKTEAWKPYVLRQIWNGKTIDDLWGGPKGELEPHAEHYRLGYFLLRAQKGV